MSVQTFDTLDMLRLEVEATPTGVVNLVQNPSGELGGWGWVTPVSGSAMEGDAPTGWLYLRYAVAGGVANHFTSEAFAVAAGQFVSARFVLATSYHVRPRVEWLNAAGAVISSSAQGAYASSGLPGSVVTYTSNAAPAGTVRARLRIDVYGNTSGGNPAGGSYVRMQQVAVIKTATGTPSIVRRNLVTNPSFETNATGWSGSSASVSRNVALSYSGSASLIVAASFYGSAAAVTNVVLDGGSVVDGKTYTVTAYVRSSVAGRTANIGGVWKTAGGAQAVGSGSGPEPVSTSSWTRLQSTVTMSGGVTNVDLYFYFNGVTPGETFHIDAVMVEEASVPGTYFDGSTLDSGGIDYAWSGTAHASTSTATTTTADFGYLEPATYIDVLGPTHSISVKRDELNLSTLTAEILDATLDPSQFNLVRPGKRVRLMALDNAAATWTPIYTGKVLRGTTKYDLRRADTKRARITMTAVDATSPLSQTGRKAGVATIAELPYVLEGCGVPWSVNGSGNQVPTASVVATNDNATALDQVAITRDSVLGYAWVDRRGVLIAWDRASIPTTIVGTLDESAYSDVDLDYDTDRCINVVTIKLRRVNIANGQTVEVTYGPYVDQSSIDKWGAHSAEFTVHGITDSESAASAFAASILAANATPEVRINSVTLPIRHASDIVTGKALLDLYDRVTVDHANLSPVNMRVTGIEHTITPDKWTMRADFTVSGSVAAPQVTPDLSNPAAAGVQQFGGFTTRVGGGWNTAVVTNGNGVSMTLPAGVLRCQVTISQYAAAVGNHVVQVYLDGVHMGDCQFFFNQVSVHAVMSPLAFTQTVSAGTHWLQVRQLSGFSDFNDSLTVHAVVTPS